MNETGRIVRKVPRETPRNPPPEPAPAADRRVLRTRRALTHALIHLVTEKRYKAITVQDLLDRADVGRSTFYAHYRGKDDLLLRSFEAMLDMLDRQVGPVGAPTEEGSGRPRVAPVRELFHHVGSAQGFHRSLARAHMLDRLYQVGTDRLTVTIERRLAALPELPGREDAPPALTARAFAGMLFALLRWWVDEEAPETPERMEEIYHSIVLPGRGGQT